MKKKTLMIITPHMSTGGCPQVVTKKIEVLKDYYDIVCIEWDYLSPDYVVQRNNVIKMLGDKFISLGNDKEDRLFFSIKDYNPDYIMIEELAETFISEHILQRLYSPNRSYKIFETTHSSHSRPEQKRYMPDKFIFVSPFSAKTFKNIGVPFDIIEYPIDRKEKQRDLNQSILHFNPEYKHIVNVGLFTPGKNQGYAFEIARLLKDFKIKFHFVGNQAPNFKHYWEPIMETKPNNCIVWGERTDIDSFLQASDLFLFTSTMELNPISIKESLEYNLPTLIFDLQTYEGKYNNIENVHFLSGDLMTDVNLILNKIGYPLIKSFIPKLKIVHLLLDPNYPEDIPEMNWKSTIEKQNLSIDCMKKMSKHFEYVQRYQKVNRTELPVDNCMSPEIINPSKEFKNEPPVLSYGHYGAYQAHTKGILENFDEDLDALIIMEGDAYTDLSPDEFYKIVLDAYNLCISTDGKLVSFAGPCYMTGGNWWEMSKPNGEWVEVPHFLLGTTYMIMKTERKNILDKIHNTGWHSPDFWLAWNYHLKSKIYVSKEKITYQKEGYSVLDYLNKG